MSSVTLVFSTFSPPAALADTVRRLVVSHPVVIVDDGGADPHGIYPGLVSAGAEVIRQPTNEGIAAALNVGVVHAFAAGADAVVTFDQDSTPAETTIDVLHDTWTRISATGERVSGIVPAEFAQVKQTRSESEFPTARRVIQSGMLIPRSAFDEIGPFDESLFIDLVDTDWELRCLRAGSRIVAAPTRIDHELGRTVTLAPLGSVPPHVTTMVSTPFRYYYRARNRLILTRRYLRHAPGRILADLAIDIAYFAVIAASARPRTSMLALLMRGARDGVRGRGGRAPAEVQTIARPIRWSVRP